MNADPVVMHFFPNVRSAEESAQSLQKLRLGIEERGWGLWAVQIGSEFAGLTGLNEPEYQTPFTPCVEIGWRFHRKFWGQGFALESARLALRFAFAEIHLREVVSFTSTLNERSLRLMQRLEMTRSSAEDFDHPSIPEGHPLRRHVLYRIGNSPILLDKLNRELAQ